MTAASVHDWLLEEEQPSIRYRTLTELLDVPAGDPRVRAARVALTTSSPVEAIWARMHPDGYWLQKNSAGKLVGDGVEYGPYATTHYCLSALAELGLDRREPRLARAAERYLDLQGADGDFWRHMSCLYAYNIRTFIMLGYGADRRVKKTIALMAGTERHDGGYLCEMHEGKRRRVSSCVRGSAKALMAYSMIPALWDTPRCLALVDYFVRRGGIFRTTAPGEPVTRESTMTVFPFTWGCGLIDVLLGLSAMGLGRRRELDRAWAILDEKKDGQRRYRLDLTASQSPIKAGAKGAPSKWVTFYALLALKKREGVRRCKMRVRDSG